jgi:hypothetical protein
LSIADHKPHVPWGGVVGLIRRHHDEGGQPTIELTDTSIREWLASGDRTPTAAELVPVMPHAEPARLLAHRPNTGPDDVQGVQRMPFTIHRDLDDDDALTEQLLAMERATRSLADRLTAENDRRLEVLLARFRALDERVGAMVSAANRAWENTSEVLARVLVTKRRRESIRPLVPELGRLIESGDVDPLVAARIVKLRADYLYAVEADSQRLPRLTPDVLAAMDAERAKAGASA